MILFFNQLAFSAAQNGRAKIISSHNVTDSTTRPLLFINIDFISEFDRPIVIYDGHSVSNALCMVGNVGIQVEKLDSLCYQSMAPDCSIPEFLRLEKRQLSPQQSSSYRFELTRHFATQRLGERSIHFVGNYRIRACHTYFIGDALYRIFSEWIYLNFE